MHRDFFALIISAMVLLPLCNLGTAKTSVSMVAIAKWLVSRRTTTTQGDVALFLSQRIDLGSPRIKEVCGPLNAQRSILPWADFRVIIFGLVFDSFFLLRHY